MNQTMVEAVEFLEEHKGAFGFAGYKVFVRDHTSVPNDAVATAECDWAEETLTIHLYQEYAERKNKMNILIHELIHAGIARINSKVDNITEELRYQEEEILVNKLANTFENLLDNNDDNKDEGS